MSLPRTLVIDDHLEEHTVVDQRFHGPRRDVEMHFEAAADVIQSDSRYQRRRFRRIRWWHVLAAFFFVLVLSIPSIFAYREHLEARALRAIIEEISGANATPQSTEPASAGMLLHFTQHDPAFESFGTPAPAQSAARPKDRTAMERLGADLLITNDYAAALEHYRALAASFPDDRAFADAVIVLESKRKCLGPSPPLGVPCR